MQTTNGTTMYSNRLLFTSLGLLLFSSFLLPTSGSATNNYDDNTEFIRTSCNTSSDPKLCFSSLSMYATTINKNPSSLVKQSISVAILNANDSAHYFENLFESHKNEYNFSDPDSHRAASALQACIETFNSAIYEMNQSLIEMHNIETSSSSDVNFMKSNVLTWMPSAVIDERTCTDESEDVNMGPVKKEVVIDRVNQVMGLTNVAVSLVNNLYRLLI
ncbi:hypothetical protein ACFE04_012851 [Oxalis oulophora]